MFSREQLIRPFTRISSPLIDSAVKRLSFSENLNRHLKRRNARKLLQIDRLKKVLVIPDINIGDAMICQSFIAPIKYALPDIEISYIYQRSASPLVCANPDIDEHFPLFRNIGYPSDKDFASLQNLLRGFQFDMIFNLNPYFNAKHFRQTRTPVIYSTRLMSNVIRNYTSQGSEAHISLHMSKFAEELIDALESNPGRGGKKAQNFHHSYFYSTQDSFLKAQNFVEKINIKSHSKKVFLNPDTSCSYTRIPIDLQKKLLKAILLNPNTHVLLNCGFTFKGIENELLDEVPYNCRDRITVIPKDTPIDVYAALTDHSDMFITGDTAPLHIAASKKIIVDSDLRYRNSTAVVGIFGATSSKIYGYDSFSDEHVAAPQSAPSKVFEVFPECKNLTCIDKIFKACPEVKCFDGLELEPIVEYVNGYLS